MTESPTPSHGSSPRPPLKRSQPSDTSDFEQDDQRDTEATPLLVNNSDENHEGDDTPAASSLRSLRDWTSKKRRPWRWPSIIVLTILVLIILVILGFGFAAPAVMEEYTKQATVFEPSTLSIETFTSTGVKARVQGDFTLDASRVHKKSVRHVGRMLAWIARAVESRESIVEVYFPDFDDTLLGTAIIPPVVVNIRNGVTTHVDVVADLSAGDLSGLKNIAMSWIKGKVSSLHVEGLATVSLKSGPFSLGTQTLSQSMIFNQNDLPKTPQYSISKLNFHDIQLPGSVRGVQADASLMIQNDHPVRFTVPPLAFNIKVPGCTTDEPRITVADASTKAIRIEPSTDLQVDVNGIIRRLPDTLTSTCPQVEKSPLDILVRDYMNGEDLTIYVSGSNATAQEVPDWIADFLEDIIIPIEVHGKTFDNLIRDFTLADVHFGLPNPFSDPGSPEAKPRVSAKIKALIGLPDEMNFAINVSHIRANADIFYHGQKLGDLDLSEWQKAESKRIEAHDDEKAGLAVSSIIKEAPINVTNEQVFAEVIQAVVFSGKNVTLGVKAGVDVETNTVLGQLVVRDIPAEGEVFVNPFSGGDNRTTAFQPKVGNLSIISTTKKSITLGANVNFTNPTKYSAHVPYANIKLLTNGTELGYAYVKDIDVIAGNNTNVPIKAVWEPVGRQGAVQGREILSQYISGYNTTLTLQTHAGTIPNQPALGLALSRFALDIPAPSLHTPKKPSKPGDDRDPESPNFIDEATFHILTSTATFTILSPLKANNIWVSDLNATAFYNHTEPIGGINYDLPWEVPPGISESPALSVDWELNGVGYKALKDAVGGRLKLDAAATATIRVDNWEQPLWLKGRGIGTHIRL